MGYRTRTVMEAVAFLLATAVGFMWGYMWADARRQIRENRMSEFKVGDRVRVTHYGRNQTKSIYAGRVGAISSLPRDGWDFYRVALDNEPSSGIRWHMDLPVASDEIEPLDG